MTETRRMGLWPLGRLPPEAAPGTRRLPPGDIPLWEGDAEFTANVMDGVETLPGMGLPGEPLWVVPDSVGGMPGAPLPLVGGTLPHGRFQPGPKDDWTESELTLGLKSGRYNFDWPTDMRALPSEPPIETPEDAAMWDRAVRRDTKGDDAW